MHGPNGHLLARVPNKHRGPTSVGAHANLCILSTLKYCPDRGPIALRRRPWDIHNNDNNILLSHTFIMCSCFSHVKWSPATYKKITARLIIQYLSYKDVKRPQRNKVVFCSVKSMLSHEGRKKGRKEMFYLTTHSTALTDLWSISWSNKILFKNISICPQNGSALPYSPYPPYWHYF